MERKIKLIWDFRGPMSLKTAQHHEKHLKEYSLAESKEPLITGFEIINDNHTTAFIVVIESQMILYRDKLKPHRGEVYEE